MPAGSLEKLKVAALYGADAVYLGTPDMSLRTKSDFSLEDVIALQIRERLSTAMEGMDALVGILEGDNNELEDTL